MLNVLLMTCIISTPPVQMLSDEADTAYRALLPTIHSSEWSALFEDEGRTAMLYDSVVLPQAYQAFSGRAVSFHLVDEQVRRFPWDRAGGTDESGAENGFASIRAFKMIRFPTRQNGRPWPFVWFRKDMRMPIGRDAQGRTVVQRVSGYDGVFPVGTKIAEVLLFDIGNKPVAYELRARRREIDGWVAGVARPFQTPKELADRIKELRPQWQSNPNLAMMVNDLMSEKDIPEADKADFHHRTAFAFYKRAGVYKLPGLLDNNLRYELLKTTPFYDRIGEKTYTSRKGVTAFAFTSDEDTIVPAKYGGTWLGTTSCMDCHKQVQWNVRHFEESHPIPAFVPGFDGILSFNPIDPTSIAENGEILPVRMRREFVQAGIVEPYDPQKHPPELYTLLPEFRDR